MSRATFSSAMGMNIAYAISYQMTGISYQLLLAAVKD
jgi:hypothetical protein